MNEILFLFFAFFTVYLSIKLSYYVDYLNKSSNINGVILGAILLAGVTSLPELVTCLSAIMVGNELLAMGDILGSNMFNIFMICFFDLIFIKKRILNSCNNSNKMIFLLLIINYLVLYLFASVLPKFNPMFIGVPTLVIIATYFYYLLLVSNEKKEKVKINDSSCNNIMLKLLITATLMVFSSVILTIIVNKLSIMHPYFSSSFLGAIFLGITTSLPEVVTCYTLISINNYELALSDIIGSNFFNLLVISIGDLLTKNNIYSYADKGVITLIVLGLFFTILTYLSNNKKYQFNKTYGFTSLIVVIMYLGYWIINFLG